MRAEGLLQPGRPVLVMLSGGRDSVALLHLAQRISGDVSALHVNYGLRGADSDADEGHCRALAERLGVPLTVHRTGPPGSGNLQAWARRERYAAARRLAGGRDMATGHTATDQVETILYRLASSPSRRALLGMARRDGQLIRPLLGLTREQTAALCRARELPWRDDASNDSHHYARGRARTGLVPALRELHPAAEANVLALAETLRAEAAVLDGLVDEVLGGRDQVEIERLRALPVPLAALALQRLADAAHGAPAPGTARRAGEILALPDPGELHLPCGLRAVLRGGVLRLEAFVNCRR